MTVREWVRIDVGLLDDDRFERLTPEQRSAWLDAYLLIGRAGDAVKDRDTLGRLLAKQGTADSARLVTELDAMGWIVDSTRKEGITLRGFEKAQPTYRGPSDLPEAKAIRNAKRPTTRAARAAGSVAPHAPPPRVGGSVEPVEPVEQGARPRARAPLRGATVERVERHGRTDKTDKTPPARKRAKGATVERVERVGDTGSFRELMAKAGVDPTIATGKTPGGSTS